MADVFISYSNYNIEHANHLQNVLKNKGITSWVGRNNIPGGTNYTKEIMKAIRNCRVFVLILSRKSIKSQYVFKELDQAVKLRKEIIPLLLEELIMPDEFDFLISSSQSISAIEDFPSACNILTSRIEDILENTPISPVEEGLIKGTVFFRGQKIRKGTKIIQCPYCASRKLRDSTSIYEYILDNPDVGAILLTFLSLIIILILALQKNSSIENMLDPLRQVFDNSFDRLYGNINSFLLQKTENEELTENIILCGMILGFILLCAFVFEMIKYMFLNYVSFINQSLCEKVKQNRYEKGISFWTFRCLKCNKKFRKKILNKTQSDYYIEVDTRMTDEEILPIVLSLLKVISNMILKPYQVNKRKENQL